MGKIYLASYLLDLDEYSKDGNRVDFPFMGRGGIGFPQIRGYFLELTSNDSLMLH